MSVTAPTFTDTVNQQFFIESQGGSQQVTTYLDRFPDAVYTKAIDSNLVTFLYALLGPAGVGQITTEYLEARLQIEDAGLSTVDLDSVYTNPFEFARLADETYQIDAQAALLPAQQRADILSQDSSFRNRAITYFKGIRAGGTKLGIELVAESGLNHPVDVIENWRWLYDQYADQPLGLIKYGSTDNLNEVIIIPRQDVPQSAEQTLSLIGNPTSGFFTVSYPAGSDYQIVPIQITSGSSTATVPSTANMSIGTWISITTAPTSGALTVSPTPTVYAEVGTILSPTTVELVKAHGDANAGVDFPMTATATYWAYLQNGRSIRLPYNISAPLLQGALWGIPLLDEGNVLVSGGPFPTQPLVVTFIGNLSDTPVQTLELNLDPDPISGIGGPSATTPLISELTDPTNSPLTIDGNVTVDTAGVSADSQQNIIAPADQHAMEVAIDAIRPQTCFVTTQTGQSTTVRQPVARNFAGSSFTQVISYVTGAANIAWPPVDNTHWIQPGIEHEALQAINTNVEHYQGFHNISNIVAYNEAAFDVLQNPYYLNPQNDPNPVPFWNRFYDTHIGFYSATQVTLVPVLGNYQNATQQMVATNAEADTATPLIITNNVNGTSLINNEYPVDYLNLPGVPQLPSTDNFWSSAERSVGQDILEIDLGSIQAVNYLYFEATTKPYSITLDYDTLDMYPARQWQAVTFMPASVAPSTTSLTYVNAQTNPWVPVTMNVTNAMGGMIYTRILRLTFAKTPLSTPYVQGNGVIPYSIEVRNLRVGRNVS
jgi:hypothetical protein